MREPVVALLRAGYRTRGRKAADAPAFLCPYGTWSTEDSRTVRTAGQSRTDNRVEKRAEECLEGRGQKKIAIP